MLKSVNRLKKDNDFAAVFRLNQRSTSTLLTVFTKPNSFSDSRVGVVVSKKVSKRAVDRNRIRRVLLSETAELFRSGDIPAGFDVVVLVTKLPDLAGSGTTEVRAELRECLKKLSWR